MNKLFAIILAVALGSAFCRGGEGIKAAGAVTETEVNVASNTVTKIYTANSTALKIRIQNVSGTETVTVSSAASPTTLKGIANLSGTGSIDFDAPYLVPLCSLYAVTGGAINFTNALRVSIFTDNGAGSALSGFTHPATITETNINIVTNSPVALLAANANRLGFTIIDLTGGTNTTIGFTNGITSGHGYANITKSGSLTIQAPTVVPLTAVYGILDGITNGASVITTNQFHVIEYTK